MNYRRLGKTGLMVSEIGFGAEWIERHDFDTCSKVVDECEKQGINLLDCWMSEPNVRSNLGNALKGRRKKWYIQGHIGSTWQDEQYVRSREPEIIKPAFEDLLTRLQTDYIDLGMIHFVDREDDWNKIVNGPYLQYIYDLKRQGTIRHIGMSTHNPAIAKLAVKSGIVEMILFSINPAFDMLPDIEDVNVYFSKKYRSTLNGIDPSRAELYQLCDSQDVGITVMKAYAGGRLFDEKRSPFGVALTPVQCLHYCLTRPAVSSVLAGFETPEHVAEAASYCTAADDEKDYASVLANAPRHAYHSQCTYCGHCRPCPVNIDIAMVNKYLDLATMQPTVPASVRSHYSSMEHTAADCIQCGICETRCPFHVAIRDRMKQATDLFT
ncbi:MAG: aldo/keto reductase [Eubacteriales bacterium]|nr:aldo/keto reductase [Eubacteriales bacterium]